MTYQVTLIPGDGIGPEVSGAARRVIDATGVPIAWEVREAGLTALESQGDVLPEETLASLKRNTVGLKGPMTTPIGSGFRSVNVGLRQALGLYANLRPGKSLAGVQSVFRDIDLVVVRENLEGMYTGIEFDTGTTEAGEVIEAINAHSKRQIEPNAAVSIKVITPENSRRIVEYAFEYARANGRTQVTAVHKANIMKFSDGLFLSEARAVAERYPDIAFNDRIVDNMCMQLMQKPQEYDVLPRRQERSQPNGDDPLRGADAASPRRAGGGGAGRKRGGGGDRRGEGRHLRPAGGPRPEQGGHHQRHDRRHHRGDGGLRDHRREQREATRGHVTQRHAHGVDTVPCCRVSPGIFLTGRSTPTTSGSTAWPRPAEKGGSTAESAVTRMAARAFRSTPRSTTCRPTSTRPIGWAPGW
ncbi:MAG: Isocitrate dehydrogenase [Thermomicrobiales bacterium]|nr:Isocitrate dehydrogenase [Thermomicrobiales bacterium]